MLNIRKNPVFSCLSHPKIGIPKAAQHSPIYTLFPIWGKPALNLIQWAGDGAKGKEKGRAGSDNLQFVYICYNKIHQHSIKEKGNLRFDLLQLEADTTQFVLYEAYEDEASAAAHKETPHYKEWRETVADWMAEPRKGVRYKGIKP
jgi:autoinducer 2-degrading protein